MREHLVARGSCAPPSAVDVDQSPPDQVTATVQVEPGPLTTERRLAFSGNTVLSEKELLAVARPRTVVAGLAVAGPRAAARGAGVGLRRSRLPGGEGHGRRLEFTGGVGHAAHPPRRGTAGARRDAHREPARTACGEADAAAAHRPRRRRHLRRRRRAGRAARAGALLPQPRLSGRGGGVAVDGERGRRAAWTSPSPCTRGRATSCARCGRPASRARARRSSSGPRTIEPGSPASPAVRRGHQAPAVRHRHVPLGRGHLRAGRGARPPAPRCPSTPSSRSRSRAASCSCTASRRPTSISRCSTSG